MVDNEEKKDPNEMTTEEAADYLFPPEVIAHLRAAASDVESEEVEGENGNDD